MATYIEDCHASYNLSQMQTAVQQAEARRVLLEAMREFVFEISQNLLLAEERIEEHPDEVYLLGQMLKQRLRKSGLTSEQLPDFGDKEYFFGSSLFYVGKAKSSFPATK